MISWTFLYSYFHYHCCIQFYYRISSMHAASNYSKHFMSKRNLWFTLILNLKLAEYSDVIQCNFKVITVLAFTWNTFSNNILFCYTFSSSFWLFINWPIYVLSSKVCIHKEWFYDASYTSNVITESGCLKQQRTTYINLSNYLLTSIVWFAVYSHLFFVGI